MKKFCLEQTKFFDLNALPPVLASCVDWSGDGSGDLSQANRGMRFSSLRDVVTRALG